MTVSETLTALKTKKGIVPSADYTGTEKADDFIFAIQTDASTQTKESDWIVFAERVKEHSGALNASTEDVAYIRAGGLAALQFLGVASDLHGQDGNAGQSLEQVFNPARIFADDVVHDDPRARFCRRRDAGMEGFDER